MKALIVIFIAAAAGLGVGLSRTYFEFANVNEDFTVFQDVMDNTKPVAVGEEPMSVAEAEVPSVRLLGPVTHVFGQMNKGETGEHEFVFKNEGTGMLEMKLTSTSCKCTLSDMKGRSVNLAPGQKYPIKLKWKSENYSKKFRQSATIQTNDPARRTITIYVEGVVIQPIRPEPANIVFSNTTPSQTSTAKIRLYGYKYKDLVIDSTEFLEKDSQDFFETRITQLTDEEIKSEIGSQIGYLISVSTKKGLPLGPLRQTLRLNTNKEEIDIPISGKVTGEFRISLIGNQYQFDEEKNQIRFGTLSGNRDVSVELVLSIARKNGGDIGISLNENRTHPSTRHIKVEVLKDKFKKIGRLYQYPIRLTIPKDCPNVDLLGPEESNLGRFVINTTHPTEKTIEFYVRFAKARQ